VGLTVSLSLFYGKTISYITAERGVRSKEELWSDIKVDVATGSRDIYAAIDGAFDMQQVYVDGEMVEQFGSISKLPPVLQIQVQRVQFDPVKKTSFKSTHHLELRETIYLDRYMDTQQQELLNRRRQCWEWKDKLRSLEARKAELLRLNESDGEDMASLFNTTKNVLEDLSTMKEDPDVADCAIDFDSQTMLELEHLSRVARAETTYVEQEIKHTQTMISSQFADSRRLAYRLYAVFMHQGSVEFGHYYIYIYDFARDVWRKYNDNQVTEVQNRAEILENEGRQNPPTPYFLIYINDTMKDRLVDPVCREIVNTTLGPTSSEVQTITDTQIAMDDVPPLTSVGDVDMQLLPYEEAWTDGLPAGPTAKPSTISSASIPLKRKGVEDGGN
jgi:ubiquitin carboxyl-terminal hydrolase 25/28